MSGMDPRNQSLVAEFLRIYGGSAQDVRIFDAPGRVNLIVEHTDYNGGHVFPAALSLSNRVAVRPTGSDTIELSATSLPDCVNADISRLDDYRHLGWGNYQLGMAYVLQQEGYAIPGCQMLFHGTVPYGGGLSSSASIEVVTGLALVSVSDQSIDPVCLALLAQRAENAYCGVNCGIMDQFASAMGKKDCAILLNCNTLSYQHVPLNLNGHKLMIVNTNKPHSLVTSKYNERRGECDQALRALRGRLPSLKALCDCTGKQLEQNKDALPGEAVYRRARHVVNENERTLEAVACLQKGDLSGFGRLMRESHVSLRDDYEVTGVELDAIYDAAVDLPGCVGVRMTGAGFGGCAVAIVREDCVEQFCRSVEQAYTKATGYVPTFFACDVGDGARELRM